MASGSSNLLIGPISAAIRIGGVMLAVSACGDVPTASSNPTAGEAYLEEAIDTLQAHSLHRYEVDWPELRRAARERANRPARPADAYPAIRYAFELIGEEHSRFLTPGEYAEGREEPYMPPPLIKSQEALTPGTAPVGYIRVRAMRGSAAHSSAMIAMYHRGIERVDTLGVCGWIIDLRDNQGGNMSPMIGGVGPIVGEGVLGHFVDPDSVMISWGYEDGAMLHNERVIARTDDPYVLRDPNPPVVVLVSRWTASAAEAVFIAFKGRPDTYSLGQPTRGFSTANAGFELSDGALMVITTSVMADRTGQLYGGRVNPDGYPGEWPQTLDPETDGTYLEALEWLAAQEACVVDG